MTVTEGHGLDSLRRQSQPATEGGMKKCQSQPAFSRPTPDEEDYEDEEEEELSVRRGRSHDGKTGLRMGEEEGEGRDGRDEELRPMERVFWWLSGVNALAEVPPSPDDIDDEPPQTDTALHVIHDGD